jgi:hypothetical protein
MPTSLDTYIADARAKQQPDDKIKEALIRAGWPEDQVQKAFVTPQSDLELPPPPPPPQPHIGMWTGFLYILFFISLYVLATAIAGLFHDMVDKMVPDIKPSYDYYNSSDNASLVRSAVAAVIVSYPIFVTLALILKKQLSKQPAVSNLRSRKLLIYITLIGTFLIMLGHIIFIIYSFLDGKLTGNAVGHLAVTFLIAGSIFGYFISEVKHDRKS